MRDRARGLGRGCGRGWSRPPFCGGAGVGNAASCPPGRGDLTPVGHSPRPPRRLTLPRGGAMKLRVASPFLLLAVALVISNGLATAAPAANDGGGRGRLDPVVGDRTCGTPDANPAEMEAVRAQVRAWLARVGPSAASGGTIAVAFHVLHDGPAGDVPDAQIDQQMKALNQSYAGTGYRFSLTSVDRTDNRTWLGT